MRLLQSEIPIPNPPKNREKGAGNVLDPAKRIPLGIEQGMGLEHPKGEVEAGASLGAGNVGAGASLGTGNVGVGASMGTGKMLKKMWKKCGKMRIFGCSARSWQGWACGAAIGANPEMKITQQ